MFCWLFNSVIGRMKFLIQFQDIQSRQTGKHPVLGNSPYRDDFDHSRIIKSLCTV